MGTSARFFLVARGATPVRLAGIFSLVELTKNPAGVATGEKIASLTFLQSTTEGNSVYTPRHGNGGGSGTGY